MMNGNKLRNFSSSIVKFRTKHLLCFKTIFSEILVVYLFTGGLLCRLRLHLHRFSFAHLLVHFVSIAVNLSCNCGWFISFFSLFFPTVPPMMMIQNQLVGAAIEQNVTLECTSEAFPKSINFWMRATAKNDSIITSGKLKYKFIFIFDCFFLSYLGFCAHFVCAHIFVIVRFLNYVQFSQVRYLVQFNSI